MASSFRGSTGRRPSRLHQETRAHIPFVCGPGWGGRSRQPQPLPFCLHLGAPTRMPTRSFQEGPGHKRPHSGVGVTRPQAPAPVCLCPRSRADELGSEAALWQVPTYLGGGD